MDATITCYPVLGRGALHLVEPDLPDGRVSLALARRLLGCALVDLLNLPDGRMVAVDDLWRVRQLPRNVAASAAAGRGVCGSALIGPASALDDLVRAGIFS